MSSLLWWVFSCDVFRASFFGYIYIYMLIFHMINVVACLYRCTHLGCLLINHVIALTSIYCSTPKEEDGLPFGLQVPESGQTFHVWANIAPVFLHGRDFFINNASKSSTRTEKKHWNPKGLWVELHLANSREERLENLQHLCMAQPYHCHVEPSQIIYLAFSLTICQKQIMLPTLPPLSSSSVWQQDLPPKARKTMAWRNGWCLH